MTFTINLPFPTPFLPKFHIVLTHGDWKEVKILFWLVAFSTMGQKLKTATQCLIRKIFFIANLGLYI
jgi:hypothetical protein